MQFILVVSDDELIKEVALALELTTDNIKVVIADYFKRSQEILAEVRPDLIVTDLRLGEDKTGLDVARLAQKFTPPIPVLMATASDITQTLFIEAIKAGVIEVRSKSIGVNAMREKILSLLGTLNASAETEE